MIICDFCGKSQHEVYKLVTGLNHVAICDECSDIATQIIKAERKKDKK